MGRRLVTRQTSESLALFGSYDIRGHFPVDFSPSICRRLADAFLANTSGPLVVARDVRRASERLETAIVARLENRGRAVLGIGIQPTPVIGFASAHLVRTGLVFTPSHNALGFAGIKAFGPTGRSLGAEWTRIRSEFVRYAGGSPRRATPPAHRRASSRLRVTTAKVVGAYIASVTRGLGTTRSVVVDGRGGATTRLAPRVLTRAGALVRELHPRFSPVFHGLSPEPQQKNVGDLGRRVRADGADLGVAFDGDGDRVAFVDERGRWVEPEVIAMLLYRNLSRPDRPLIATVDASQRCEAIVPTVRSRVGSRYVSAAMRRHRSTVGFEASSHFYLGPWGPNSDGILTACVVCHLLDKERTPLGELSRAFGPVVRDRQQLDFESRAEAIWRFRDLVTSLAPRPEKGIDGFVFRAPQGSVLLRLSNTQPTIRILLEPNPGLGLGELRREWERASSGKGRG